jgi:NADPH:quinone reductase-like Zn-dependent oxidoreductase
MLLQIGADYALDYTREDPIEGQTKYDVVVDIAGNRSVQRLRNALEPHGTLVIVGGTGGRWTMGFQRTIGGMLLGLFIRQRIVGLLSTSNQKDLAGLANLMASGKVRPVVQPSYPWRRAAEAIESVGGGRGAGTVVVSLPSTMNDDEAWGI